MRTRILYWGNWMLFPGYRAMSLGPFIVTRPGTTLSDRTINHESIHWAQQKELAIVGFYLLYLLNWIINLIRFGFNQKKAYREIIFEKEAKENERNLDYLKTRRSWEYLRKKK